MANSKIMKCWNCGTDIGHQSDEDNFFWCNSACREAYEGGIRRMDEKLKQEGEINGHAHRTGVPAEAPSSVTRLEPEPVAEGVPTPLQFPQIQLPPGAKVLPLQFVKAGPDLKDSAPETSDPAPQPVNPAPEPLRVPVEPVPALSAEELRAKKLQNLGKKQRTCGNCGESGHDKRKCPRPKTVKPAPVQAKRCSNCGRAGHNARTCKTEAAE